MVHLFLYLSCVGFDCGHWAQVRRGRLRIRSSTDRPLSDLEHWEEFLQQRYPEPGFETSKARGEFRDYRKEARPSVREFYRLNHAHQTYDFVQHKKRQYLSLDKRRMGVWEAMEYLNTLVDDSDPDTDLSQIEHLLQAAEAARDCIAECHGAIVIAFERIRILKAVELP